MKTTPFSRVPEPETPLSSIEDLFIDRDWMYERRGDDELAAEVSGRWCDYRVYFVWRPDLEALMMTASLDVKVPQDRMPLIQELLAAMNPRVWMGHFELSPEEHLPTYRYCLSLKGTKGASDQQIFHMIDTAIEESDRFYPALQFVLWGGKDAEEAVMAVMLDTVGEA